MKNQPSLSPEATARYKREGFLIAKGLLPEAEVARVFADMHILASQQLGHFGLPVSSGNSVEDVHRDLQALLARDTKTYLATLSLASRLASFLDLFLHPAIRAAVSALGPQLHMLQTGPILHLMSPSLKIPGGYDGFSMHQDWPSQQGGLDGVTVWIPLVDVEREMHTMELIPRSHTRGLYPDTLSEHIREIDPASYDENDLIRIEAQRGDVVFFSAFLLHRSCRTGDGRLRVAASVRYENAGEAHFIARGYPLAQKRFSVKELITPDFPTQAQVQKVFE